MDEAIQANLNKLPFSNARISTMTVLVQLSTTELNITRIIEHSNSNSVDGLSTIKFAVRIPGNRKNKKQNIKSFKNSLSIIFEYKSRKICVKVFSNGKLHVTGCHSVADTLSVATLFCTLYYSVEGVSIRPISHDVHMYNIIFSLDKSVNLNSLHNNLKKAGHVSIYNRDVYSGIKIKKEVPTKAKPLTILGFSSGNFIFAGLKTADDIGHLKDITDFLSRI